HRFRYSLDGRHVVGGGRKGHLFSFDWLTKHPCFELNIMESVHDVCFLQTEKWIAVAQKKWTYIYDDSGKELHCLKPLERILKLEFLPHHLLLCAGSESGFLNWLDVTIGDKAIQVPTRKGKIDVMCQNPWNAVICCGHTNGTVTMWTPNVKEPVFSILCYPQPIRSLAVDPTGRYMATGCLDRTVKIWDTRNLGHVVSSYKAGGGVNNLAFSQRQLLALSYKDVVEQFQVYKDVTCQESCSIYMKNHCKDTVTDLQFCPYEDILGCATQRSFSNFIIPGSGEPNFDALEANPYKTLSYRREAEVKTVLEKVPYSLITLDPKTIAQVSFFC
ncbi:UNVERIFIED_CONTAM: hypothetical protein GTU68_009561, partial [Idotea baltica]|nr:hypothetical protein [Idotea baltica]